MIIFSTADYEYLRDELCAKSRSYRKGGLERQTFPDGEKYLRITETVDKEHCIIIGGTHTNDNLMEIFDLGSSLVKYGASKLTIIIPYYGYSTMERAVKFGEVVTAKTRASLLSHIPRASYGNEIVFFELHTEAISHYLENDIVAFHQHTRDIVIKALNSFTTNIPTVIATTDVGRAKTIEYIAREAVGLEPAFVYKRRESGSTTEVTGINADVSGKPVVIYDDMIRSGGSLIKAAKIYKEHGATEIYAVTTHGVFAEESWRKILGCGYIKGLAVTNSHPNAVKAHMDSNGEVRLFSIINLITDFFENV